MSPRHRIYWNFSNWSLSGVCTFTQNLIEELGEFRHEVHIVRPGEPELAPPSNLYVRGFESYADYTAFLRGAHPGVLVNPYSWRTSYIERIPKHRYIQVVQSHDPYYYIPLQFSKSRWDGVIGVSSTIRKQLQGMGIEAELIPNGIRMPPLASKSAESGVVKLLYTGRLDENQKNVSSLIPICERLRSMGVPYKIRIIGNGHMEGHLRRFFSGGEMLGYIDQAQLAEHYQWAQFFLLPSKFEGEPLSLMEALGHGCIPVLGEFESDLSRMIREQKIGYSGPAAGMPGFIASRANDPEPVERAIEIRRIFSSSPYQLGMIAARYREQFDRVWSRPGLQQRANPALRLALLGFNILLYKKLTQRVVFRVAQLLYTAGTNEK